jgi:hypothetical protein
MAGNEESCVKPSKGPLGLPKEMESKSEVVKMMARVGKPAPDFEASAYVDGGFENIRLSDYKGQWVTLCFYPGDFTFV